MALPNQSTFPLDFKHRFPAPCSILRRPLAAAPITFGMPPPTLWRNAHTIPVHCLIHGSACPGCWECTGQVVGKVCTIPGTAPATWHPASPPCSRPSDPAATASDESGPRSAPNPSQPVENFHLHPDRQHRPAAASSGDRWNLLSHKSELGRLFSASQLSPGRKRLDDKVNGV